LLSASSFFLSVGDQLENLMSNAHKWEESNATESEAVVRFYILSILKISLGVTNKLLKFITTGKS
jgi:hypothetical protein